MPRAPGVGRSEENDPLLPSGVPRSIEFTISTLGARHERRQRRAKQDGASRQLIYLKASIRLDVVFARDRPPQSHLLADELPKLFRAAQRERHLLGLIELLGDARFAQRRDKLVREPADDRLGRPCRCKNAPPGISFEPGIALGYRGHIRERRSPGLA